MTDNPFQNDPQKVIDQMNREAEAETKRQEAERQRQEEETQQPQAAEEPQMPKRPDLPSVVSDKAFRDKPTSFLKEGFLKTLDKKIEEALRGNTPEEVAQNVTFAALTLFFEMLGNWVDHHRKERERVEKEYKSNIKAFDRDMHVHPQHKDLAYWAVVANDPYLLDKYGNRKLTSRDLVDIEKYVLKNQALMQEYKETLEYATGREWPMDSVVEQAKQAKKNAFLKDTSLQELHGIQLNSEEIKRAVAMARESTQYRKDLKAYRTRVEQLNRNRAILNNHNTRTNQQRQRQQTRGESR